MSLVGATISAAPKHQSLISPPHNTAYNSPQPRVCRGVNFTVAFQLRLFFVSLASPPGLSLSPDTAGISCHGVRSRKGPH